MQCPNCGFDNPPDAEVCQQCETSLPQGASSPEKQAPSHVKVGQLLLWFLVILSLALNGVLIYTLFEVHQSVLNTIASLQNTVVQWRDESIIIPVKVDQQIPFQATVPISETLTVPLNFDYPLSTVVNTSVRIPLVGEQDIAFPIDTVIPVQYTLETPIQVSVPISMTYHLQTEIPVSVEIPQAWLDQITQILEETESALRYE
ncbi:MAG: zinc ribbon domain-containing protein [Anaerolineales bacterium]